MQTAKAIRDQSAQRNEEINLRDAYREAQTAVATFYTEKSTSGFAVGDTVRITGETYTGQQGELAVIDNEAPEGDYFGVYLDSVDSTVFFAADELEAV